MYRLLSILCIVTVGSFLWMQSSSQKKVSSLRIGVTAGPHALIVNHVKKELAKQGVHIEIIEFNDFHMPNTALDTNELDINIYQHEPFLKEDSKARGLKLKVIGKSVLMPLGLYSVRHKNIQSLTEKSQVALPSDPTNRERAQNLCKEMGIHHVHFIEVDAPQLPRAIEDVDAALIPTDWVLLSKMNPQSALCHEDAVNSPFTNVIVGKEDSPTKADVQKFLEQYQSDNTKQFIEEQFHGALIAGW